MKRSVPSRETLFNQVVSAQLLLAILCALDAFTARHPAFCVFSAAFAVLWLGQAATNWRLWRADE